MALMSFIFFSFLLFGRTSVSNENCLNSLHQGSKDAAVARIVYFFFSSRTSLRRKKEIEKKKQLNVELKLVYIFNRYSVSFF